jgi:hypothetical protein
LTVDSHAAFSVQQSVGLAHFGRQVDLRSSGLDHFT